MSSAMPMVAPADPRYYDQRPRCRVTNKVVFYFEARAALAAATIQSRTKNVWNTYLCRECRFWHVGHARVKGMARQRRA